MHESIPYIPLTFKLGKLQPRRTFFLEITILFLLSLLLCGSVFLKKKSQLFQFEISFPQASKQKETHFATRKILQNSEGHDHWHCRHITFSVIYNFSKWAKSKCWHLILPGVFPDKVTPDIDFTDETVVQCDAPVAKILLQVLLIYK